MDLKSTIKIRYFLVDESNLNDEVQSAIEDAIEENANNKVFGAIIIVLIVVGLVGNILVFMTITVLREYKKSVTTW